MNDAGVNTDELADSAEEKRKEGQTVMFVAVGQKLPGIVADSDPIKESTPDAIKKLHSPDMGTGWTMTIRMIQAPSHMPFPPRHTACVLTARQC